MSRVSASRLRRHEWMLSVVIAGFVLAGTADELHAQGDPLPHRAVVGFTACVGCHGRSRDSVGNDALPLPSSSGDWILDNEVQTWARKDKHHQAYAVLFNKRSFDMGRLMKIESVHRDKRCLSCHTGYPQTLMPAVKQDLVDETWGLNTDVSFGITCEGCHGAGGDLASTGTAGDGWFRLHLPPLNPKRPWRFLDPKTKWEQHGYVDVRTPSSKARLCGTCHIGDAAKGRVVTHEMYAAGHPPLPGFEIATFAAQMPVHWRSVASKSDRGPQKSRSEFLAKTADPFFSSDTYRIDSLHRTQSMLVGALVSLAQSLELTAGLSGQATGGGSKWPELSQFECYACHHDLKVPAWRQKRSNPAGVPGRPVLREWATVLARVALGQPKQRVQFDSQWKQVHGVLAKTPFGSRSELARETSAIAKWLMAQAKQLERKPLTREDGRRVLLEIARVGAAGEIDYESSRQLVWACEVVFGELGRGDARELKSLRAAGHVLTFPQRPFQLEGEMDMEKLSPEAKHFFDDRKPVEVDLSKLLPPIGNFDPSEVTKAFRAVEMAIKAWPPAKSTSR